MTFCHYLTYQNKMLLVKGKINKPNLCASALGTLSRQKIQIKDEMAHYHSEQGRSYSGVGGATTPEPAPTPG